MSLSLGQPQSDAIAASCPQFQVLRLQIFGKEWVAVVQWWMASHMVNRSYQPSFVSAGL
jgi:hypothetical protein